jgi:DNA-binding NtrC family response regulator
MHERMSELSASLQVLQVEDSESDALLIVRLLEKAGYTVRAERVEDAPGMRAALESQTWDVIVADYRVPGFDAPAALRVLQETGRDIPFIVVSGAIGEDVAVQIMKLGAHDCVMKNNRARLAPAVEREIREARIRQARRAAEQAFRESEVRERARAAELETVLNAVPAFTFIARDPECRYVTGNRAAYELLGLPLGSNLSKFRDGMG